MMKRIVLIVVLVAMAVCFSGCQMMEGFGKDVQWTGESIQKTAK
ncbi:MAG: entericidin A/B family lipoprotein [Sedimentisphaerales bacterium]|nr:entericidin A/B family lipoprotein [Sedimentisphaerales bacterium]